MWEQQSSKVSAFSFCFQPGSLTILDLDGCTEELHLKWGNGRHLFTRLQFLLRHHVEQVKTTLKFYLLPSNFSPQIIKLHINLYDNSWFKDSLEAFFPCAIQSVLISYLFYTYLLSGSVVSDPLDCSLPDSSLHGIFQARILEWVAISYSKGSSWPRDRTHVSWISCIGRWILYRLASPGKWNISVIPFQMYGDLFS